MGEQMMGRWARERRRGGRSQGEHSWSTARTRHVGSGLTPVASVGALTFLEA